MFEGQPKGLFALALANTGERFGYYTMLAVFALFLRANYGLSPALAGTIYSAFLMFVYFFPLFGGMLADKFGFGRMVTTGIIIMFAGYVLLSVPLGGDTFALIVMLAALLLIGFGTGLFKGNLQVMVGDLYNDPQYKDKRDAGFSIFYMAINIGALFAPTRLCVTDPVYRHLLSLPFYLPSYGGRWEKDCHCFRCSCRGTLKRGDETAYRCLVSRLCCGDLLLDGFPSERFVVDIFR